MSTHEAWATKGANLAGTPSFTHYVNGVTTTYTPPGPGGVYFTSIVPIAANDVWITGYTISPVSGYLAHWNGTSWAQVANASGLSSFLVKAGSAISSDDVWFTGYFGRNGLSSIFLEHWDGHTMTLVGSAQHVLADVGDVVAFSPSNVLVLFTGSATNATIAQWNGSTFTFTKLPALPNETQTGYGLQLAATSPNDIWAVADTATYGSGTYFTSSIWGYDGTWRPYTFIPNPGGGTQSAFQGVAVFSNQDAVITGTYGANTSATLNYTNYVRWHPVSNSLNGNPFGRASHIAGTTSFWNLTTTPDAELVTCK